MPKDYPTALVVASFGRHVQLEVGENQRFLAYPKGKKNLAVVGDLVHYLASHDEARIEKILARKNLLYRQDALRSKQFAANIDQILFVLASEPQFSEHQLSRALIAAHEQNIPIFIGVNKIDLHASFTKTWQRLEPYRDMGYELFSFSAIAQNSDSHLGNLYVRLVGKTTLILGASGVGKSSLINAFIPNANAQTQSLSSALNTGKHTTTATLLHWINYQTQTALIDSPGFQEFGLHHIQVNQLASYMPDIKAHAQNCKFYNCSHLHEPFCNVRKAVQNIEQTPLTQPFHAPEQIHSNRYKIYCDLYHELNDIPKY